MKATAVKKEIWCLKIAHPQETKIEEKIIVKSTKLTPDSQKGYRVKSGSVIFQMVRNLNRIVKNTQTTKQKSYCLFFLLPSHYHIDLFSFHSKMLTAYHHSQITHPQ